MYGAVGGWHHHIGDAETMAVDCGGKVDPRRVRAEAMSTERQLGSYTVMVRAY